MHSSPELSALFKTVLNLDELQRQFIQVAPAYLAQSSQVTGLRQGTLNIAVCNGTLAAKLRQLAPEIVTKLQAKGCEISGIRVKVQVSYAIAPRKHTPRLLSNTAHNQLKAFSLGLADSPLKQALEKFSKKKG